MSGTLHLDSYLESLLLSAAFSLRIGTGAKKADVIGSGRRAGLAEELGHRCWTVEDQRTLVPAWWDPGSSRRMHRELHGLGYRPGGLCICSRRCKATVAPQFLILKTHRCHHVSLGLKEEQPNLGARSCRLPGQAAASPRGFIHLLHGVPSADEVAGECSHHVDWLHFRFLASDCKGAVDTASQSSLFSFELTLLHHKDCAFALPSSLLSIPALLLTEPHAWLVK